MKTKLLSIALFCLTTHTLATTNESGLTTVTMADGQTQTYEQLIAKTKLAGVSMAVVDDYEVVYSRAAGVKAHGSNDKIDVDTAFSTASISKAVTATVVAMLVEKGVLNLDVPVSQYLKRWAMPDSNLTKNKPITLRHLLTHTAGLTQGGFADYYLGDKNIPTLIDSLNGVKLPRYNKPISVMYEPGSDFEYSGGGYVIIQVALEDVTGKSLAELADEMLFQPLAMKNTTMYQHGHPKFLTNVAKVHNNRHEVIGTGIPICPQTAPSGMWSNALDMAKLVIDFQKALAGKPSKVISPWVAKTTTSIQTVGKIGAWGLGWMRNVARGNLEWFSHDGSNTGTGGIVMATMESGRALIIMANGSRSARNPVISAITDSVMNSQKWQKSLVASQQKPAQSLLKSMIGRYLNQRNDIVTIEQQGDGLILNSPGRDGRSYIVGTDNTMVFVGDNRFEMNQLSSQFKLSVNPTDQQQYLTYYAKGEMQSKGAKLHHYAMRKLAPTEQLPFEVASSQDFATTLAAYQDWKKRYPRSDMVSANALNVAGYRAFGEKNVKGAINILRVYTTLYPQDANAYDSLAEVYMLSGNKPQAIKFYNKSLILNPGNDNAKEMLVKLGS